MRSDIVSVLDNYYKCEREKNNKGYLILFKVKGIPHGEKMHRRRR